jgi:RND family efflux transporter MFP subunit
MGRARKSLLHAAIAFALVALGAAGMVALTANRSQLERRKPPTPVPKVQTIEVETTERSIVITGRGTVRPLQEINLVPQVGGRVIHVSPVLVNGGQFRTAEVLLRIDPVDYRLAVTLAQARVEDSQSRLKVAREEAAAAREEWRLLYAEDSKPAEKPPPLVAKEPQLKAARARLEADRAELRKAELNLERTVLRAPFTGRVSEESVDIGQYVVAGQPVATLYSTEAAEIVVPLENDDLQWIRVPGFTSGSGPGSPADVRARVAGRELSRPAEVVRAEGRLDERTRMINVVVRVEEPYATKPPLAIGLFVTVAIRGRSLPEVAVIPRAALRPDGLVWVVEEGVLRFRKVEIARIYNDEVTVQSGLEDGELVVISPLKAVTDGMRVRTAGPGIAGRADESLRPHEV